MDIFSSPYLILAISIFALFYGADKLVNGSVQIAAKLGIPPAIIGLTIVALGTSTPEIFSSISAQMLGDGKGNIAIGNVVGSNLCNIGLILGLSALIVPIPVAKVFTKREMPMMLFVSFVLLYFVRDGLIAASEGLILLGIFVVYTAYLIYAVKKDKRNAPAMEEVEIEKKPNLVKAILFIVIGMVLLGLGGKFIISSSIAVCTDLGMSEKVVGLLMVAFGTSCPELAASIVASLKKESDILVGNIVGSNALNIMIVCGITPLVKPIAFDLATMRIDIFFMLGLSVLLFILSLHKSYFHRWKGGFVLGLYVIYTINTVHPFIALP